MPGPPGPAGPAGPAGPRGAAGGSSGSFTPTVLDIWGGYPPESVEEAINRIASVLYIRTLGQGPLNPIANNAAFFVLPSTGGAFIVKYATDGTPQWVRRIYGAALDQGNGVSADMSGNVIVTGYSMGTAIIASTY